MKKKPNQQKSLFKLEKQIKIDFKKINYPEKSWIPKKFGPDKKRLLDVLIIGSGMNGLSAAFALKKLGINNIKIVDKNPPGMSGPWKNTARMNYLRSPKQLVGPAQNFPNLTFRSWWEATHERDNWNSFEYIERITWSNYLIWFSKIIGTEIDNLTNVKNILPPNQIGKNDTDYLKIKIEVCENNKIINKIIFCRQLILATGREGLGKPRIPKFFNFFYKKSVYHSSDIINFKLFKNKRVVVVGIAASAFDNAATASENHAKNVKIIGRSKFIPKMNKMKQTVYPGFAEGFSTLSKLEKIKWIEHIQSSKIAPPKKSIERISNQNIKLILNSEIIDYKNFQNHYKLTIINNDTKLKSEIDLDYVILATGFEIDIKSCVELKNISNDILLWKDIIKTKNIKKNIREILNFPYLEDGFEFKSNKKTKNYLHLIRCFNHASLISLGNLANDIPHSGIGADRLSKSIAKYFFKQDRKIHFSNVIEFKDLEITGNEPVFKKNKIK